MPRSRSSATRGTSAWARPAGCPWRACRGGCTSTRGTSRSASCSACACSRGSAAARSCSRTPPAGSTPAWTPGDLMLVTDHLNLMGRNPLAGPNEGALGPALPGHDRGLRPRALRARARGRAGDAASRCARASTRACSGRRTRRPPRSACCARSGADAVGMSTVPEVIALRHMGVRAAAVSCITNLAAGLVADQARSRRGRGDGEAERGSASRRCSRRGSAASAQAVGGDRLGRLERAAPAPCSGAPTRPTRATSSARRCRTRRAPSSPAATWRTPRTGCRSAPSGRRIVQMVAAGEREPVAIVVVTPGPVLGTPCGACRQTLAEFARDLPIRLVVDGRRRAAAAHLARGAPPGRLPGRSAEGLRREGRCATATSAPGTQEGQAGRPAASQCPWIHRAPPTR